MIVLRPIVQTASADRLGLAALATRNDSPQIDSSLSRQPPGRSLFSVPIGKHPLPFPAGPTRDGFSRLAPHVLPDRGSPPPGPTPTSSPLWTHRSFSTEESQIALTPDDSTMRLRRTIANLPDVPFHDTGRQVQPVVVRAAHLGMATCLYVVNDSSLTLKFELVLDCPPTTTCRSLESGEFIPLEPGPDDRKSRLVVETAGHGVMGCRLDQAGVTVVATNLTMPAELLARVHRRIDTLGAMAPTVRLHGYFDVVPGRHRR